MRLSFLALAPLPALVGAVLVAPAVHAQTGITAGPVRIDAYADAYFTYDLNSPPGRQRAYATQTSRHNEFAVNLALLRASYSADRVRGTVSLGTGTYVEANYGAEPPLLQAIQEAYAGVRVGEGLWVDAGTFYSHIGSESAIPALNPTYSRSLVAEFSPFYESGVRATYTPTDRVTLAALVLNGWQNQRETNADKAAGTQVTVRVTDAVTANWSTFIGNEAPDDERPRLRTLNDVFVTAALTPTTTLTATFDVGTQRNAARDGTDMWLAGALIGRMAVSGRIAVNARAEGFHDPENAIVAPAAGVTASGFRVYGGSLGLDVAAAPNALVRFEARALGSPDRVFPTTRGGNPARTSDATLTASIALSL